MQVRVLPRCAIKHAVQVLGTPSVCVRERVLTLLMSSSVSVSSLKLMT